MFDLKTNKTVCLKKICMALYLCVGAFLIWRCFLSFCQSDESFYIALVDRLWKGDRLFLDEWNPTQMYAIVLFPIYSVYRWLVGSTDGIFLFFRLVIQLWEVNIGFLILVFYWKRERDTLGSFLCVLIFLFFHQNNILGPSYYTIATDSMIFAYWCYISHENDDKYCMWWRFTSGICCAIAVLAVPFLAVAIIIFDIYIIVQKNKKEILLYNLGILFMIVYFLLFCGSNFLSSIDSIVVNVLDEPGHASILSLLYTFVDQFFYNYGWIVMGEILLCIALCVICKMKMKNSRRYTLFSPIRYNDTNIILLLQFMVLFIGIFTDKLGWFGHQIYPVVMCSPIVMLFIFLGGRPEKYKDEIILWLFGLGLMIAFACSSNTGLAAPTTGVVFMAMAVIQISLSEINIISSRRINRLWFILMGILVIITAVMGYNRISSVYRDDKLPNLIAVIDKGPAKGLYTSKEQAYQYNEMIRVIDDIEVEKCGKNAENRILFSRLLPWAYVYSQFRAGTPTVWSITIDDSRLESYYTANEECMPNVVVVVQPTEQVSNHIENLNSNNFSGWMANYIEKHAIKEVNYDCANVYFLD